MRCSQCGLMMDWQSCDSCGGYGGHWESDGYGREWIMCRDCDGEEGHFVCLDCEKKETNDHDNS